MVMDDDKTTWDFSWFVKRQCGRSSIIVFIHEHK